MANKIYTIGREFGSGGREVGEKLAAKLGIKLYDKELLQQAAKDSGFCEEIFENHDEKPTNSFLYSLVMDTYSLGYSNSYVDMPINHKVFLAQFDAIKKLAERESCVIVGRCSDYILRDRKDVLNVFIHGDIPEKMQRIMGLYNVEEKEAVKMMADTDKRRMTNYNFYTEQKWGMAGNYTLSLNSSALGYDMCQKIIMNCAKI